VILRIFDRDVDRPAVVVQVEVVDRLVLVEAHHLGAAMVHRWGLAGDEGEYEHQGHHEDHGTPWNDSKVKGLAK
jgi:hypothetical protein